MRVKGEERMKLLQRSNQRQYITVYCTEQQIQIIDLAWVLHRTTIQQIVSDWLADKHRVVTHLEDTNRKAKTIRLSADVQYRVRVAAVEHYCNIYDIISSALARWMDNHNDVIAFLEHQTHQNMK